MTSIYEGNFVILILMKAEEVMNDSKISRMSKGKY